MILALIEQNPFDRIAYSWGSFHAIHQNHCHIHSDCFIDISVQLGRSGAPWFLTNYSGFECRSCQNSVFLFGLTITAGACARGRSASTGPQITCAGLSSKDLDATVSPVDAPALLPTICCRRRSGPSTSGKTIRTLLSRNPTANYLLD